MLEDSVIAACLAFLPPPDFPCPDVTMASGSGSPTLSCLDAKMALTPP